MGERVGNAKEDHPPKYRDFDQILKFLGLWLDGMKDVLR